MKDDKLIQCRDCMENFIWTASEQEFYEAKGFTPPKRCPDCRVIMHRKEKHLLQREVRHD